MPLRNADVKEPVGVRRGKDVHSRSGGHRRRNSDYASVAVGKLAQRLAHLRRKAVSGVVQLAGLNIKASHPVELLRVLLGVFVALALLRDDMDEHGFSQLARPAYHGFELAYIVPVDGAEIIHAHTAENIAGKQTLFQPFFYCVIEFIKSRKLREHVAVPALEADISGPDAKPLKQPRRPADVLVYGHVVVVKDDNKRFAARRGVRKPLVRKSAAERAVPYYRGNVIIRVAQCSGSCHTERYGHGV